MIEPEAYLSAGVKVYPFKTIEAGAVVNASVIWESRGQRTLFGPRGVSGLVNVEITPELCVRLASAYATTLKKGAVVTTSRDVSRAARALKRAVHSALNASAINVARPGGPAAAGGQVRDRPQRLQRGHRAAHHPGRSASRSTSCSWTASGADLSHGARRRLERVFSRQEYRRAFPGEIAELTYPPRVRESYARDLLSCVDMTGVADAGLKVVVDCAGGTVSLVLPALLGRIGMDVLTVNSRLDERNPTQSLAQTRAGLQRLAELVASSRAAFGVRFDPVGERITLVDDQGGLIERRPGAARGARPDRGRAPQRAGGAAGDHHPGRRAGQPVPRSPWSGRRRSPAALARGPAGDDVIFAADGRGGFVVPEFSRTIDGIAAFVRLLGLVARTRLTLSQIDARIPVAHLLKRSMPTPWAAKGSVMRTRGGGGRRARRGHHRRGAGGRAGRRLGAGPARPVGRGHAPVGRSLGSGQYPCASG